MGFLTIDGFEKLSKQQLFDMSVAHIGATRQKCTDNSGACMYQGIGCAAAPFLQETLRRRADGLGSWNFLAERLAVPEHEVDFITNMQRCHDNADNDEFMKSWSEAMRRLAQVNGVSTEKLDAIKL